MILRALHNYYNHYVTILQTTNFLYEMPSRCHSEFLNCAQRYIHVVKFLYFDLTNNINIIAFSFILHK